MASIPSIRSFVKLEHGHVFVVVVSFESLEIHRMRILIRRFESPRKTIARYEGCYFKEGDNQDRILSIKLARLRWSSEWKEHHKCGPLDVDRSGLIHNEYR